MNLFRFILISVLLLCTAGGHAAACTITAIPVEAEASQAQEAKGTALLQGQQQAFSQLVQSLVPSIQSSAIPTPSVAEINQMVQGFEIRGEKISSRHYRALLDVTFVPSTVNAFLAKHHVTPVSATNPSKPAAQNVQALSVYVPITRLEEWVLIQKYLSQAATITQIDITSLSTQKATLILSYTGTREELTTALKNARLSLTEEKGTAFLYLASPS